MDKTVEKEHIVLAAAKSFAQKGVKTVGREDIAGCLGIVHRDQCQLAHGQADTLLDERW